MRGRFLLAASLAWVFTIALGMLAIFRVYLLPRTIPSGSPDGTANISYSEPSNDNVVVGVLHKEIVTWLDIKYVQQIDASSSERVTAEVDQAEVITDLNTKQPREPSHLPKLNRPVRMLLQSAAFDFGNDDGVRFLPSNTKTPVILTWTPIPRQAGKVALNLRLKDVYNATGTINGVNKNLQGNDDIPLTVDVRTVYWLTPFLQSWILWLAAGISFIVSSYLTWKGTKKRPSMA